MRVSRIPDSSSPQTLWIDLRLLEGGGTRHSGNILGSQDYKSARYLWELEIQDQPLSALRSEAEPEAADHSDSDAKPALLGHLSALIGLRVHLLLHGEVILTQPY